MAHLLLLTKFLETLSLSCTRSLLLLCCIGSVSFSGQSQEAKSFIEDTLGGLRLGDPIDRAIDLYPRIKIADSSEGMYEVNVGDSCLLTIRVYTDSPNRGKIKMIFLDVKNQDYFLKNPDCSLLRTSHGFLLGQNIETARSIYSEIPIQLSEDQNSLVLSTHNGKSCRSEETGVMKSMLIVWDRLTKHLKYYSVEASEDSCLDYRAGKDSEDPSP